MPVSAVPAAPPLAVLVLAWGEATPAVRALVEATQASAPVVDSMLILVPQAAAPAHLSAEEYLPVPALAPAPHPVAAATALAKALPPRPDTEAAPAAATRPTNETIFSQNIDKEQITTKEALALPMSPTPLDWAAVRVVRLGSFSLPQLAQLAGQPLPAPTWLGPATAPATPYLGASARASQPAPAAKLSESAFDLESLDIPELLPEALVSLVVAAEPLPITEAGFTQEAPLYDPIAQAPTPEADLPSVAAEEPAAAKALASNGATANQLAGPAPRRAVLAGWPEALAALRQPASLPELPIAVPIADIVTTAPPATTHPALRPAATHYPAPDLNFQIIQYARFAVPVVLAEAPFAVVYAPAWPTWLAAQELRQRTGQPLVLHVSSLAAADDESVETATGWIAELQRQALHRADLILAETPALAQRLRLDLGLPANAVLAVPAANAAAIAQALHGAQLRPALS
ncbi:glycosyltransferase [Hymenobacter sp. H14-R3]|uniref:glycosyltransferase n=1 Tax=Hymenobacter sp. H14-R3 TaxID=3046308 RepID=UPI0024BB3AC0|nr:glycosyltransferase [Hymenobacter sp. H14-R3]MDJ0367164.1 glycosyltransferase [Hymenobacter sp. H14-R3]